MKKICLLFILLPNFCISQVNLKLGLKAYYPFSGNAKDESGNNNHPVFNNARLAADRFGNPRSAYHFDGASTYMKILNSPSLNTSNKLSLCAWVRPQGFYSGKCHGNSIIMKGDTDYLTGNYLMRFDDNAYTNGNNCYGTVDKAHQNFYGLAMTPSPGYSPYIKPNQWYSVILTHDGNRVKLYIDCKLVAVNPQQGATFSNSYDLFLGRLNDGSFPYWFNGDMDEVRIYDRVLNTDEVNTLGGCSVATPCTNWLNTPGNFSYATIGDLDVPGNQLTIEAVYNRTKPLSDGLYPGFLVSKHTDASNDNYSLFPNGCAITTTNGYKETFENCAIKLNKTYHVAMVYNGSFLKFYRNGFLHSQVACTGKLILNNLQATIAQYAGGGGANRQFLGQINEVRIWNVARTQAQLKAYMNTSLPNPTTTPGLLGYYTFDNLLNKQGNTAFNAKLNGAATINATNRNCVFVADSCDVIPAKTSEKPQYVKRKAKEKKDKDIVKPKKVNAKPDSLNEMNPLFVSKEPVELSPGVIKLLTFDTEKEIVLEERKKDLVKEIAVDTDSISITLYDNAEIDGDSITLIYNDKILTTHQRLTDKPLTFWIKIAPGNSRNELVMYAENQGSIPPNTALMIIYDGNKRYEINIKSTEKTNGSVSFRLRE